MNKENNTISGKEIVIALGQQYQTICKKLKPYYDTEFEVNKLLDPIFTDENQILLALKIGKKRWNRELKRIKEKKQHKKEVDAFRNFVLTILVLFGFSIFGIVKFIQMIF